MGVGGTDTARGISFQHAQAVAACLDVLESQYAKVLRVEGADDVIDFEMCSDDGERLRVCQAKTRKEPYRWEPGPLVAIIKRWQALDKADDARFEFLTDGSVGPEVADSLLPALRRARKELTEVDRKYLKSKDLDPDAPLLKRIAIESRQPDADVTLDRVTFRLLRLLEMGAQPADTARAEGLVNTLFRTVSTRSGLDDADDRTITRAELSELIGVPLDVIDRAQRWTAETEKAYVKALRDEPPHTSFVALQAKSVSLHPDALTYVVREQAEAASQRFSAPATDVLDESSGAVISGPAGAGKSTTLELLVPAALDRNLVPVLVSVEGYEGHALVRLVRETLERRLACRLAPGATSAFLRRDGAALFIDGAGELDAAAREALIFDVQNLQRSHAQLRVVVTSRDATRLRALNLPGFVLQGLDRTLRRKIADELLDPSDAHLVAEVEQRLETLVENPLLFVMALGLAQQGVHARSRVELFEGFVDGLAARPGGEALSDLVVALVSNACFSLREGDSYGADPWTWRRLLAAAMDALVAAGLYPSGATSADDALDDALTGGLLRLLPGSGVVALAHDLFCDFFASQAVHRGQRELPPAASESLEEAAVFLAERGDMPQDRALRVATNPVAAARCAHALPLKGRPEEQDVTELYAALRQHLGEAGRAALSDTHIRVAEFDDGVYLFVLAAGALPIGSELDVNGAAAEALRAARVPTGSSSLTAAVALWLAELRRALAQTDPGELLVIPEKREEVAEVLARAFAERVNHLGALCTSACPTLRARVLRELDFRGFHAVVLPSQSQTMPIGGGEQFTYHPFAFSFNADDVMVRVADEVDDDFIEQPSTQMASEDWLRDSPLQAALNDVLKVLSELLPGFAR